MKYLEWSLYDLLYARYLNSKKSGPETLFEEGFAAKYSGTKALDLCGGNGRMSIYLTSIGLDVTYVEGDICMTPIDKLIAHKVARVRNSPVEEYLEKQVGAEYSVVTCQQAINYWLNEETAELVSKVIQPGGIFVFNTFNERPSEVPNMRMYSIDGLRFMECFHRIGNRIHHVQIRQGLPMHLTEFDWISPEQFREWLTPHFSKVVEVAKGKTSVWTAVK